MLSMTASTRARTGVLIIRLWVEDPATKDVRARIIQSMDVTSEEPVATSAATVEGITVKVRDWLEAFVKSETGS